MCISWVRNVSFFGKLCIRTKFIIPYTSDTGRGKFSTFKRKKNTFNTFHCQSTQEIASMLPLVLNFYGTLFVPQKYF